jgi:multidrug efflux system outer membrane protein
MPARLGLELAQAESALSAAQAQWSQVKRLRALSENQIGLLTGQPGLRIAAGRPGAAAAAAADAAGRPALHAARSAPGCAPGRGKTGRRQRPHRRRQGRLFSDHRPDRLYGSESMALANLFTGSAGIWSAAIGLAMPIFDAGKTGPVSIRRAPLQKESLANYRKTLQTAFREVNDAIVNLREYADEEAAFAAQVEASKRPRSGAETLRKRLFRVYIDLLDSQRTLNTAQLLYLASRKNRLGARQSICSRHWVVAGKPRRIAPDSG